MKGIIKEQPTKQDDDNKVLVKKEVVKQEVAPKQEVKKEEDPQAVIKDLLGDDRKHKKSKKHSKNKKGKKAKAGKRKVAAKKQKKPKVYKFQKSKQAEKLKGKKTLNPYGPNEKIRKGNFKPDAPIQVQPRWLFRSLIKQKLLDFYESKKLS